MNTSVASWADMFTLLLAFSFMDLRLRVDSLLSLIPHLVTLRVELAFSLPFTNYERWHFGVIVCDLRALGPGPGPVFWRRVTATSGSRQSIWMEDAAARPSKAKHQRAKRNPNNRANQKTQMQKNKKAENRKWKMIISIDAIFNIALMCVCVCVCRYLVGDSCLVFRIGICIAFTGLTRFTKGLRMQRERPNNKICQSV